MEENLAEMLENHELRRPGEAPAWPFGCLSVELDRESRRETLDGFEGDVGDAPALASAFC